MATARRFAFVERIKSGQERLMLANLDSIHPLRQSTARVLAQMGIVPGELPTDGSVPETYVYFIVRPDNAYVAAYSVQIGSDFVDLNIAIYDMETGAQIVRFNEHSVAGVNRANCSCPLFDAYLASEAAFGVSQSQLDSYDYRVISEGTGIGEAFLAWSATGSLIASYGFDVVADGIGLLGMDRFVFEIAVTGGALNILSRNVGVAYFSPVPPNSFSLRPKPGRVLPTGPNVIHYGKRPVLISPWPWRWLPRWRLGFPYPWLTYKVAKEVQGFV